VNQISQELLNGFAPNSQGRRVWSLARTSLNVKVRDQRSKSTGTKNALCTPITPPGSNVMERARCKERHAVADGTIPSMPGVILAACLRFLFGKTSLALVFCLFFVCASNNQASGYAYQHIWRLCHATINREGCGRKGIWRKKMGDDGGGALISPDGVAPSRVVGVSASVIFPCTIKSRRFLLAPITHPGSPRKRAVKWLCVRVCL